MTVNDFLNESDELSVNEGKLADRFLSQFGCYDQKAKLALAKSKEKSKATSKKYNNLDTNNKSKKEINKPKKILKENISRKDALDRVTKTIDFLLNTAKYKKISVAFVENIDENDKKDFLNGEIDSIDIYHYDLWDYNPEARTNDEPNQKFYKLLDDLVDQISSKLIKYGYTITVDGDWDGGYITMATNIEIDESVN